MKRNFLFLLLLFMTVSCSRFVIIEKQIGLQEFMTQSDDEKIIKIDTVYNPLGGVIKVLTIKRRM